MSSNRQPFPSTQWSRILARDDHLRTRDELEALMRRYWRPIHTVLRSRWHLSEAEADDHAQGFVLALLEGNLLDSADPRRGRFRTFVRAALDHYMTDHLRATRTEKRGGTRRREAWVDSSGGAKAFVDRSALRPDELLDAEWRRELVTLALREVEEELRRDGKEPTYRLFEDYFVNGERSEVGYRELGARYGIGFHDVSNQLRRVKSLYRARLRARVMETVTSPEELEHELEWLFGREPGA